MILSRTLCFQNERWNNIDVLSAPIPLPVPVPERSPSWWPHCTERNTEPSYSNSEFHQTYIQYMNTYSHMHTIHTYSTYIQYYIHKLIAIPPIFPHTYIQYTYIQYYIHTCSATIPLYIRTYIQCKHIQIQYIHT